MTNDDADRTLNEMLLRGELVEAFERFASEDVVLRENQDPPIVGKVQNLRREMAFRASLATFHEIKLLSRAVSGDVSFSEWIMDFTQRDGVRIRLEQVAVRHWRDGQLCYERFYYRPAPRPQ